MMKLPWMSSEHVARDVSDRSADQLPPSEVVGFLRRGRSFHPWQLEVVYGRSDVPPSHRTSQLCDSCSQQSHITALAGSLRLARSKDLLHYLEDWMNTCISWAVVRQVF